MMKISDTLLYRTAQAERAINEVLENQRHRAAQIEESIQSQQQAGECLQQMIDENHRLARDMRKLRADFIADATDTRRRKPFSPSHTFSQTL